MNARRVAAFAGGSKRKSNKRARKRERRRRERERERSFSLERTRANLPETALTVCVCSLFVHRVLTFLFFLPLLFFVPLQERAKSSQKMRKKQKKAAANAASNVPTTSSPAQNQNAQDVYGDLFSLGPSTAYGPDEPGMVSNLSNPMLYFGDDPVGSGSWDIPTISGQDPALGANPARCSTPMSNYGLGGPAGVAPQHSPGNVAQANPYDVYGLGHQGHQGHAGAGVYGDHAGGPGGHHGPQTYTPMGSYGQGDSAYHGRMVHSAPGVGGYGMYPTRVSHHHHQVPHHPGGHPHPAAPEFMGMQHPGPHGSGHQQHRSMSHYAASTIPPMSSAMSSSKSGGGSRVKMEGRPDQGGNGVTSGSGKKKSSNKRKGASGSSVMPEEAQVGVGDPQVPPSAYMQQAYHMQGPPATASFYPQGGYSHQQPLPGRGYNHPQVHEMNTHKVQQQQQAAGAMNPHMGDVHHNRKYPMGSNNGSQQGQEQAVMTSPSHLGERELSIYVKSMLSQLLQVVGMLDVNTKKTISDSLLRLASTKQQMMGGTSSSPPDQSVDKQQLVVQKMLDRSICQLLYNTQQNA